MTPPTQSRKQREIAEREELVLEVAARLLVDRGYLGLTMDRIAQATEYSKGTIYQHFANKEEVLAALATRSSQMRVSLFERAATFPGRPRERLAAVGVAADLFVNLHPLHFQCEGIACSTSFREKTSPKRLQELEDLEYGCMNVVLGLARDAVAQGDLAYEDPLTPQRMVVGLWSMSNGFHQLASAPDDPMRRKLGLEDASRTLFQCFDRLLDGFGWRPLSTEWDYPAVLERVREEIFHDEFQRLARR